MKTNYLKYFVLSAMLLMSYSSVKAIDFRTLQALIKHVVFV